MDDQIDIKKNNKKYEEYMQELKNTKDVYRLAMEYSSKFFFNIKSLTIYSHDGRITTKTLGVLINNDFIISLSEIPPQYFGCLHIFRNKPIRYKICPKGGKEQMKLKKDDQKMIYIDPKVFNVIFKEAQHIHKKYFFPIPDVVFAKTELVKNIKKILR